jgi:septal ring factor EnvC (AmiA/AmiB activator)
MRLPLLLNLNLLLLSWQAACAQSADDYFHGGAQSYITNNITGARQAVDAGLATYPDDIKLKKLDELLNQQNQQNQQSQQNQKQQQQSKQNQSQQRQQQRQDQQAHNQSSKEKDKQQQEQDQQAKSDGKQSDEKQADEKQADQTGQTQEAKAREMSPEQAKRLLDAQKGDEQFLQLKPKSPPESPNKPTKDW